MDRFDRLAAIRGDTQKGLPTTAWQANLEDLDRDLLLRAAIEATRSLILPEWESMHAGDRRPQIALEATEVWLRGKTPEAVNDTKTAAKECTAARNETFGRDHRIPEAARAIAWAVTAKDNAPIWDAFAVIEEELIARVTLVAEYQRVPEQRRNLLACLKRVLVPAPVVEAAVATGPVPYAASGSFTVGQELTHPKFGNLRVVAASASTIDVQLPDGTTKRLAHKPK
ncbi:MAG: hypothetical protein KF773_01985 [Deltaproteobacteria bacterium]|nr:hypothetical protein [Deltaproteobacteria bacterium]MCW5804238.1 hypothetical protein [Deltaproteobacteria bacterium]